MHRNAFFFLKGFDFYPSYLLTDVAKNFLASVQKQGMYRKLVSIYFTGAESQKQLSQINNSPAEIMLVLLRNVEVHNQRERAQDRTALKMK